MADDRAWAIFVSKENFPAILSESGRAFDRHFLERWYEKYGEGFFVRDKLASHDCCLFKPEEFFQIYMFAYGDLEALCREVIRYPESPPLNT